MPVSTVSRRAPLWTLFGANAVSNIGDVVTLVAVPWFVLQTTGSASKTGLVAAISTLSAIIAGIFGGTIVDRTGFKRMSILSDVASGLAVAMIPILDRTIGIQFWELLLLVFLTMLFNAPGSTARQSLLPDLVELAGMPLERANAAYNGIQRSSMLFGPPVAGVLIALLSAANVLWVDAGSFLFSAVALALAIPKPAPRPVTEGADESYFGQLRESLRFIRRDQLLLTLLVILAVINFVTSPLFDVVFPVYARDVFGSSVALGIMLAGFGAGSLVSILIYGAVGHRVSRRLVFVGAFIVSMIPAWILTITPNLVITTALMVAIGIASGPLNPMLMTIFQERTPPEMRGRLFGIIMATAWIAMPLGMLTSGFVIQSAGLRVMLIIIAAAFSLVTIGVVVNPTLHAVDAKSATADADRAAETVAGVDVGS